MSISKSDSPELVHRMACFVPVVVVYAVLDVRYVDGDDGGTVGAGSQCVAALWLIGR